MQALAVHDCRAIRYGQPKLLTNEDSLYLLSLAHHKLGLFFDEYQHKLNNHRHHDILLATVHWPFSWAGPNIKQVQKFAHEGDPIPPCWLCMYIPLSHWLSYMHGWSFKRWPDICKALGLGTERDKGRATQYICVLEMVLNGCSFGIR